ncbi:MAG: UTRA domain-containing protein [Shimia sp.]|nr:UTRA domain-containing protein [Shimia sp.]
MTTAGRVSYQDVKAKVLTNIRSNIWAPGTLLPGEIELAETFGCSRATVNRAMRELVDEGLIDRKRKAGTMVKHAPTRQAKVRIPLVREEIENSGGRYRYALVQQRSLTPPNWLRVKPGWSDTQEALHIECVHYRDGKAYMFEDRWINLDTVPQAKQTKFDTLGPNEWLIREIPFSEIEMSLCARNATPEVAAFLDTAAGEAVFTAERMTRLNDASITFARLFYHQGFKMTMQL